MKASELNINKLVIALSILRETESYLRETTDIGKAASGRGTLQTLDARGNAVEKLIAMVRLGDTDDLSEEDEVLVTSLTSYFTDTLTEVETDKAIPEGEELLVLPDWKFDDKFEGTFGQFLKASAMYAVAARTGDQKDIAKYLEYVATWKDSVYLEPIVKAGSQLVNRYIRDSLNLSAVSEFGPYLNIHSWKEMGNAIENLVNRVNAKESAPAISELTLSLDDFDRIGSAVDAMYGTSRVAVTLGGRERSDIPGERPVPHYTRANKSRNPNVVLVLKGGKIDGVSFTGF